MTPDPPNTHQETQDGTPDLPSFVHELASGVQPSEEPVTLDADTARDVARQLREIEEARAAAAVSGRDYLIR
jgi:hypothetical protein